jgi:hypothetical protein
VTAEGYSKMVEGIDLGSYEPSAIWDIIDVTSSLTDHQSRIEYQIRIRSGLLVFYTICYFELLQTQTIILHGRTDRAHRLTGVSQHGCLLLTGRVR